jgi:hypothetical protein
MQSNTNRLIDLPIYCKALEIFKLSRNVASYISFDKNIIEMHQSTISKDVQAGILTMNSLALAPKIAAAETNSKFEIKMRHARTLKKLSKQLQKACDHLENTNCQGKEFIQLLKNEIQLFKKMQRSWVLNFK